MGGDCFPSTYNRMCAEHQHKKKEMKVDQVNKRLIRSEGLKSTMSIKDTTNEVFTRMCRYLIFIQFMHRHQEVHQLPTRSIYIHISKGWSMMSAYR